jgi:hypothetical protein
MIRMWMMRVDRRRNSIHHPDDPHHHLRRRRAIRRKPSRRPLGRRRPVGGAIRRAKCAPPASWRTTPARTSPAGRARRPQNLFL